MAYTPQTWLDLPSTTTPVSASRLTHMEVGIDTADTAAAAAVTAVNARCLPAGDLSGSAAAPTVARINGVAFTGTPTVGQVPTATSSSAATWQTPSAGGATTLDGLTDVTAPTPANDDLLQLKAGAWVNRTPVQLKTDLVLTKSDVGLSNVSNVANPIAVTGTPTTGQVPTATSGTAATWQTPSGGGATTLDGLTNVTVPTPANDDLLQLKAGVWVNRTITQFKVDLGTLNQDTTGNAAKVGGITVTGTPTTGQVLTATSGTAANWQTAGVSGGVDGGTPASSGTGTGIDGGTP